MIQQLKSYVPWLKFALGLVAAGIVAHLLLTPASRKTEVVKTESIQSEIVHADKSVTLERIASNAPPSIPAQNIPGKAVRVQKIQVRAKTNEPVKLEMVTSETKEGTRVTVKAENGEILGGAVDQVIPRTILKEEPMKNALHILATPGDFGRVDWGIMYQRHQGRLTFSAGYFMESRKIFAGVGVEW